MPKGFFISVLAMLWLLCTTFFAVVSGITFDGLIRIFAASTVTVNMLILVMLCKKKVDDLEETIRKKFND